MVFLRADFDTDSPGSPPAVQPAGEPDGDSLDLFLNGGTILVQSSVGTLTNQPVVLTKSGANVMWLDGILDPALEACDKYTVRWRVMARQTDAYFACNVTDPSGHRLAGVLFNPGGVLRYDTAQILLSVSYSADVDQLFEMSVDNVARTTSLSIDGAPVPEAQDVTYDLAGDGLRMFEVNGFGPVGGMFVVDEIEIMGTDCPWVAVDAESWGHTKAGHR